MKLISVSNTLRRVASYYYDSRYLCWPACACHRFLQRCHSASAKLSELLALCDSETSAGRFDREYFRILLQSPGLLAVLTLILKTGLHGVFQDELLQAFAPKLCAGLFDALDAAYDKVRSLVITLLAAICAVRL